MDFNQTVYSLCQEHKELRDFLISKGFDNLKDDMAFNTMAKMIKLEQALKIKQIDKELFLKEYENYTSMEYEVEDIINDENAEYLVAGAVPCPIKVPLIDVLNEYNEKNKITNIKYDLRTANLSLDFLKEKLYEGPASYPDMITSAGYDLVLDKKINKIIHENYFVPKMEFNEEMSQRIENIEDPMERYRIISIVPAVFIVSRKQLNGREIPRTWEDLLHEDFESSLTIPMMDLDMYNALVLTIYSKYGEEGLKRLKKAIVSNMHPAQMVKASKNNAACVSVAPYFFASMIQQKELELVWPEDGAIVSPILMTIKKGSEEHIEPSLNYLLSEEVNKVFSNNGKFPVTTKVNFKQFQSEQKLIFAGWDLLNNIDEHVETIEKYFKLGE